MRVSKKIMHLEDTIVLMLASMQEHQKKLEENELFYAEILKQAEQYEELLKLKGTQ